VDMPSGIQRKSANMKLPINGIIYRTNEILSAVSTLFKLTPTLGKIMRVIIFVGIFLIKFVIKK
jgi:hypothetical protein